ncbi:MAG: phosphate/phosphite/phosphonate ABC transporter substrate-binding protein [candidate division NC10 bacterium]|nr:phosphate/phosphite/phosphonate ABC transporter substrate-binding protein [candidate division NC10 bacterium]
MKALKRCWRTLPAILCVLLGVGTSMSWGSKHEPVIRLGLIPTEDARAAVKDSEDMIVQLEKLLGMKLKVFVATDYTGVTEALKFKRIDAAFLGPFGYILARDVANAGVEAFASPVKAETGEAGYRSICIARADSPMQKLEDFRGKTFSFTDPASTSGNLIPRYMFKKVGIEPERDFKAVMYSGGHDASALAVAGKKLDGSCFSDEAWSTLLKKGVIKKEELRVIARSDLIPGNPMVWREDLPPETKERVRQAFLTLKDVHMSTLGKLSHFIPYSDKEFDGLRDIVKEMKIDLKKQK